MKRPQVPGHPPLQGLLGPRRTPQRGVGSYPCLSRFLHLPHASIPKTIEWKRPRSCPVPGKKGVLLMWCFQTPLCPQTQAFSSAETSAQTLDAGLPITAHGHCLISCVPVGVPRLTQPGGPNLSPRTRAVLFNTAATSHVRPFASNIHFSLSY